MDSHVHAPNTSLSNLSTCQQHMFCKKSPVGAGGGKKRLLLPDQREEMLFSSSPSLSFYLFFSDAVDFLLLVYAPWRPPPAFLALQKFELGDPRGGSPTFSLSLSLSLYRLQRVPEIVEVYCSWVPERSFLIPEFLEKLEITGRHLQGLLYPHQEGSPTQQGSCLMHG